MCQGHIIRLLYRGVSLLEGKRMINSAGPEQPLETGLLTWLSAPLFLLASVANIVGALLLLGK